MQEGRNKKKMVKKRYKLVPTDNILFAMQDGYGYELVDENKAKGKDMDFWVGF